MRNIVVVSTCNSEGGDADLTHCYTFICLIIYDLFRGHVSNSNYTPTEDE